MDATRSDKTIKLGSPFWWEAEDGMPTLGLYVDFVAVSDNWFVSI